MKTIKLRRQLTMATLPPWVMPMLEAEFYNTCKEHLKRCTSFCRDCTGKLLCETCTEAMVGEHEGHKIIKVIWALIFFSFLFLF